MNFSGLEVMGGYFNNNQEFRLFDKSSNVASIIYGKNGSGKSSISRAIKEHYAQILELGNEKEPEFTKIVFNEFREHPKQGTQMMTDDRISSLKIAVYNEDFILENIHFKDNGLDTIVMLGDQNDLNLEILKKENFIEEQKEKCNNLQEYYNELQENITEFEGKIKKELRENWAKREGVIRGYKQNASVDNKVIDSLLEFQDCIKTKEQLLEDLNKGLEQYKKINIQDEISKIDFIYLNVDINSVNNLLQKTIEEPLLNEREKSILSVIKKSKVEYRKDSDKFMKEKSEQNCPYCYQEVSEEYKDTVIATLEKMLQSGEANIHIKKLEALKIDTITLNVSKYIGILDEILLDALSEDLNLLNISIGNFNQKINLKIENPYIPIDNDINLSESLEEINKKIQECNLKIEKFNENVQSKDKIKEDLSRINKELSYKEIKEFLNSYKIKKLEKNKVDENLKNELKIKRDVVEQLKSLELKLSNIDIACDVINAYLKYIFYDSSRLKIHPQEGFYIVKCRGENVKLSSLSIGERNAISICYFFSQLFKGKAINEVFRDTYLLVIDDPISSFDFENKVGIYSFLRFILSELHSINSKSKAIIFTHDLESFQHFQKIYSDINLSKKISTNQLINKKIETIKTENFNEYSVLLQNIYDYAAGTNRENFELTIGNIMRRVLEAFATFNFKMGIDELTTNNEVLSRLPSEAIKNHYKNSMYRLVLNSESHFLERTRGLIDREFMESFSTTEKIKISKDILFLLYTLNPLHVEIHLKKEKEEIGEKIQLIELWGRELV